MNKVTIDPSFYESFNKLDDEGKQAISKLVAEITDLVEAGKEGIEELLAASERVCAECLSVVCKC